MPLKIIDVGHQCNSCNKKIKNRATTGGRMSHAAKRSLVLGTKNKVPNKIVLRKRSIR